MIVDTFLSLPITIKLKGLNNLYFCCVADDAVTTYQLSAVCFAPLSHRSTVKSETACFLVALWSEVNVVLVPCASLHFLSTRLCDKIQDTIVGNAIIKFTATKQTNRLMLLQNLKLGS